MLILKHILWLTPVINWNSFIIFLHNTEQNQKFFGDLVELQTLLFVFFWNFTIWIIEKEILFELFYFLFVNDVILICPKFVDKLLQEFLDENLFEILFIFPPVRRGRRISNFFHSIEYRRLFWLVNDMRKFPSKSYLARTIRSNRSELGSETNPSQPSLITFGITFSGDESQHIKHVKAVVKQSVINLKGPTLQNIVV